MVTTTFLPQVPATAVQDIAYSAAGAPAPSKENAARHAWRKFKKLKYGWTIPISSLAYPLDDCEEVLDIPYVNPVDTVKYLMQHQPSVLIGGLVEERDRIQHLEAFWTAYKDFHPQHPVYSEHAGNLSRVVPVCWHGDEGRGKKRGHTIAISLEAVIGIYTSWHIQTKKRPCTNCGPSQTARGMFPPRANVAQTSLDELIQSQWTNMKGHSCLQHYPVFVLPGSLYKEHKGLMDVCLDKLGVHLKQGFYEGFDIPGRGSYFMALVGAKGDLKWMARAGRLTRSFEHMGRKNDLEMCHECEAGSDQLPWEEISVDHPRWENTVYNSRPWQVEPGIVKAPYDLQRPEAVFRRDVFHLCKVGAYRDFVGSSILLLCSWGYFGLQGTVPKKLECAHKSFKLYCLATRRTPGLRSFTRAYFNYKNASAFGWTNSKGSDTMLMMQWLRVFCVGCTNDLIDPQHNEIINLIYMTAGAGIDFFKIMNNHGLFLTFDCMLALWSEVRSFIRGYAMLAHKCHTGMTFRGYSIKPKIHLLRHQECECYEQLLGNKYFPNPLIWGCEQNEDWIGRTCKLSRRCDSRLVCQRVLQSLHLKSDMLHRKWLKGGPGRKGKSSQAKNTTRLRTWPQRRQR